MTLPLYKGNTNEVLPFFYLANSKREDMSRQRDNKGRFVKGINPHGSKAEAAECGRKGGIASGESRRNRKTVAEVLRKVLDEPSAANDGTTRLDMIVNSALANFYKKPSMKGLKILTEILGELEENLNVNHNISDKPVINIIPKKGDE